MTHRIGAQIAAIESMQETHRQYGARRGMRPAEVAHVDEVAKAVVRTLLFVQEHEAGFRLWLAERKQYEDRTYTPGSLDAPVSSG